MLVRTALMAIILVSSVAITSWANSGTPEEQAACRQDVRRFCSKLPRDAPDGDYLACLQAHRERLAPKCLAVLTSHGQ
jgi:hypothetical protein